MTATLPTRKPKSRAFAHRPIFETIESRVLLSGILFTSVNNGNWSDGATWDKGVAPGAADLVYIDHGDTVTYDQTDPDTIARLEIHGNLVFNPNANLELNTTGNIVIHGELEMKPSSSTYKHTITFKDIDESKFVGGGMEVLETDVGMWIHESGKLDAIGTEKTPWTRLTGSASLGATTITVQDATGWNKGDVLTIAPTQAPTVGSASYAGYDTATITDISGNTITLSAPLAYHHPMVNSTWTAEVLNLTRNVVIKGDAPTVVSGVTYNHRAHIMFMHLDEANAQTIKNIELAYMGPNKNGVGILGRYALHFHMNYDATQGSLIENVVAHDIGAHVFVPHASHGITFKGTVSHNTFDAAYWWDSGEENASNDSVWDQTVASYVRPYSTQLSYRLPGYLLGQGTNNTLTNSVAVGVRGNEDASGFTWPEGGSGIWTFENNLAHNNQRDGIFTWQNTGALHVIEDFTAYYNSDTGIEHGAYANSYTYRDITLYGNLRAGFFLHSSGGGVNPQTLENLYIDAAGISNYALEIVHHNLPAGLPTIVKGGEFKNYLTAGVAWTQGSENKEWFTFDGVKFGNDATAFLLHNGIQPDSLITVRSVTNEYYELRRADQSGYAVAGWNAAKTDLDPWLAPDEAARTSISHTFTGANGTAWDSSFWNVINVGHTITLQSNTGEIRMATGGYGMAVVQPQSGIQELMVDSSQLVTALASTNTVGMQGGLIARRTDDNPGTYYKAVMNTELNAGRTLSIIRVTDGGETVLARVSNWNPTVNYNIRFEVTQENWSTTRLKAKIWDAATSEPSSWTVSRTDTHPALQNVKGQIGLFGKGGSSTARYWRFDNYSASVPLPSLLETWTGPDAAGWPAQWTIAPIGATGMAASIAGNKGKMTKSISLPNGDGLAFINNQVTRDVDITAAFSISSNAAGFGLMARGIDTNSDGSLDTHYYTQVISSTASSSYTFRLYKSVGGTATVLASTTLYAISATDYKMRLQVFSNPDNTTTLKGKMWLAADPEPSTWSINVTNSEPALQNVDGHIGMRFKMFQNRITLVDDFTATFGQDTGMMLMMMSGGSGGEESQSDSRLAIKQGDTTLSGLFGNKQSSGSNAANPLQYILKLLDESEEDQGALIT